MTAMPAQILELAARLPEGAPLAAKALLHLGERASVDQALSRLVKRGSLLRAGRGVYVRPVHGRFGERPPSVEKLVAALAAQRGEIIVSHGAAAANALGLTTQVPVRPVYLTSGASRLLRIGGQAVELKHAPPWQLAVSQGPAGEALRALAWLGPATAPAAVRTLKAKLPPEAFDTLAAAAPRFPSWLARALSGVAADG